MRYIADTNGYVKQVSFGADIVCGDDTCVLYEGSVPTGYASLEDWFMTEIEKLYRWKIVDGQLVLDSAAVAPSNSISLTILNERVRGLTYDCHKENGRTWLRMYVATNSTLNPGYWYDLVKIDSNGPVYMHALALASAKMASVRINTNVIQIRPHEEIVAGYDLYITGSWA